MNKSFWVWQDKEAWNSPVPKFGSPYGPLHNGLKGIWITRPVDNQWEAERLYKENHNSERANREWSWLNRVYPIYCNLFPKSWMK